MHVVWMHVCLCLKELFVQRTAVVELHLSNYGVRDCASQILDKFEP